jgi:3-deoxy-manno-octulosonate cytidylyltransferase (CMP-KDO synthetase)
LRVLIVIPARMKATRLPNKPLAMVGDAPMIVQVWRRAVEAKLGDVVVACDGEEIAAAIRAAGGVAVITDPDHPSGSDRIWEVVSKTDHDTIINLQGDVPMLEPQLLHDLLAPLKNPAVDIATLAAEITRPEEHENPSVVKVVAAFDAQKRQGAALYFTRATAPYGEGPRYHHIGVYAYRRAALAKFVSLPPSPLELREKLEQLRALEAGMRIDVTVVDTVPLGVDTPEDLERAREWMIR